MRTKVRYSGFSAFLRAKREGKFRSAREFCGRVNLKVSYPQYSRYEAGEQLPNLPQALSIGQALEVPVLQMVLEWNMAQLEGDPDQALALRELKIHLRNVLESGTAPQPAANQAALPLPVELDDVIVFNRSHRALFMKDPSYRDIFTYVNAINGRSARVEEISKFLKIPARKLAPMLENLVNLGVIHKEGEAYAAAKRNFYFPDDEDFFELRHQNLRHNLDELLGAMTYSDLVGKKAYRNLITRELTAAQFGWALAQMEGVLGRVIELPEDPGARAVYSICAVLGERFSLPSSQ